MIGVNIRVYSALNHYLNPGKGQGPNRLSIPAGITVRELIEQLNIPQTEVMIVKINGDPATRDKIIAAGDFIELYPWLAGG